MSPMMKELNIGLTFQCHIEMTADVVQSWCDLGKTELEEAKQSLGVQQVDKIQKNLAAECA